MIEVIGGTYREIDFDDISYEIFGSGFRCVKFLLENKCKVKFFTCGNEDVTNILEDNRNVYSNFEYECTKTEDLVTFKYSFALDDPIIFPSLLNIVQTEILKITGIDVICYGMLESKCQIKASKVVYDPQTASRPSQFSTFGEADELVYIVNKFEAQSLAASKNIEQIKDYFFIDQKVIAFIVKNGPYGATLYCKDEEVRIPSFITDNVFKIGSGDIFTASFGYYWMNLNLPLKECALNASKSTAFYCNNKAYSQVSNKLQFPYLEFNAPDLSGKQVYLASPFFSISDLILIDKIRQAFLSFGIKVFSPFHDIGLGDDTEMARKDIEGINNSDIVFCVLDNLDSGTLFEAGYCLASNKKIIGYHRTCTENSLFMLKLGNVRTYNNLTTAIYQTIWSL